MNHENTTKANNLYGYFTNHWHGIYTMLLLLFTNQYIKTMNNVPFTKDELTSLLILVQQKKSECNALRHITAWENIEDKLINQL